jgi:hypothetical protein
MPNKEKEKKVSLERGTIYGGFLGEVIPEDTYPDFFVHQWPIRTSACLR